MKSKEIERELAGVPGTQVPRMSMHGSNHTSSKKNSPSMKSMQLPVSSIIVIGVP